MLESQDDVATIAARATMDLRARPPGDAPPEIATTTAQAPSRRLHSDYIRCGALNKPNLGFGRRSIDKDRSDFTQAKATGEVGGRKQGSSG